jgi:MarR family transcriptional regulator for hemolysin
MRRPGPPATPPLGLQLTRTARAVSQAFERAMAEAGGSVHAWQVLLLVRTGQWGSQSRMAAALGVTGATLTHHLNAMERDGLVRRRRDEANRRVQLVELTAEGEAMFDRLREVATAHDARIREHLSADEQERLGELLEKLRVGVGPAAAA